MLIQQPTKPLSALSRDGLLAAVVSACLLSAGCGQMGPLYLPTDETTPPKTEVETASEPVDPDQTADVKREKNAKSLPEQ